MLILSSEVAKTLAHAAESLPQAELTTTEQVEALRVLSAKSEALQRLIELAKAVFEEQGFVQIRGLTRDTGSSLFPAIGSLVGALFIDPVVGSALIRAHVKPREALMGNQLRYLPFHTDYSMLADPPRLTMSLCIEPDPTPGWGALLIADVEAMSFGVESDVECEAFQTISFPFASKNAQSGVDLIDSPIISRDSNDRFLVRYHRSRIVQGFRAKGIRATKQQAATMLAFERSLSDWTQILHPEAGDITLINNRRTVHGRTRCSIAVHGLDETRGRQMQFIFAY